MKKSAILWSSLLLFLLLLAIWSWPLLTQEENPRKIMTGIAHLAVSDADFVKYHEDSQLLYYVSASDLDPRLLAAALPLSGYALSDQMGSGYLFTEEKEPENTILVSGVQFSRCYRLWKVPRR